MGMMDMIKMMRGRIGMMNGYHWSGFQETSATGRFEPVNIRVSCKFGENHWKPIRKHHVEPIKPLKATNSPPLFSCSRCGSTVLGSDQVHRLPEAHDKTTWKSWPNLGDLCVLNVFFMAISPTIAFESLAPRSPPYHRHAAGGHGLFRPRCTSARWVLNSISVR